MKKYSIIQNDYKTTTEIKKELLNTIDKKQWIEDNENPDYIFVLGGDGTFLKAFQKFCNRLDQVKFVPIKSGGVGYYTYNNTQEIIKDINNLLKDKYKLQEVELLEIKFKDNNVIKYSINELKIVNNVGTVFINMTIDKTVLQRFQGTGITFSTATGSGGFMRAARGSLILPKNSGIWQYNEMEPVSTNNYRSLNSSLILSKDNIVELEYDVDENIFFVIDAKKSEYFGNKVEIKLSKTKAKLCLLRPSKINEVELMSNIFTKKREY